MSDTSITPSVSTILITKDNKYKDLFHSKLVFSQLTDEHIVRLVMLQKIKLARKLEDKIKIYLHNCEIEDFNISNKLKNLLKYESDVFNISVIDINDGYNEKEITEYSNKLRSNEKR
jgi:hypothetical protein